MPPRVIKANKHSPTNHSVYQSGTATGIARNALDGDGRRTSHPQSTTGRIAGPEEVAEAIVRSLKKKKRLLVLSKVGKLAYVVSRVAPGFYARQMRKKLAHELTRE